MDLFTILMNSLWAALFAGGMGILLTAPQHYLAPAFLCGFAGRLARDLFMTWGMSQNWSTAVGAAVIVLVAFAVVRRNVISPVVLVSAVLPLGAAVAMFNAIVALMKVSSLKGEALSAASVTLSANIGKVFTTSLAIALGMAAGMAIVNIFIREKSREEIQAEE